MKQPTDLITRLTGRTLSLSPDSEPCLPFQLRKMFRAFCLFALFVCSAVAAMAQSAVPASSGWVVLRHSLVSIPVFAYAGRRWLDCGIEQSARFEQAGSRDRIF